MGSVTRWDLLPDGTCYQMGPVARWDLLPDGTCYQMEPVTRWDLLPDGTCYHEQLLNVHVACVTFFATSSVCYHHFQLPVPHVTWAIYPMYLYWLFYVSPVTPTTSFLCTVPYLLSALPVTFNITCATCYTCFLFIMLPMPLHMFHALTDSDLQ